MSLNSTWFALNTLRVLSIISMMLVIATCVIVNVKGFPSLGQSNTIFQFLNRCVFALVSIVLIFAEFGWPKRLFYWFPMLDETHSWSFFGFLQIIIGSLVLGYDSGINSLSFLGHSLFIFVVVPGWLVFIIGIIYMLLGSFGGVMLKERRKIVNNSNSDVKQRPPSYTV